MLDLDIEADFRHLVMDIQEGLSKTVDLFRQLSRIDAFASGWQGYGARLTDDEAGFIRALERAQVGEGAEGGYYSVVLENARGVTDSFPSPANFLAGVGFNRNEGYLDVKISMRSELAKLKTVFETIACLEKWAPLQHVSATPLFYSPHDSPIDHVMRRGIGWAGWVPFRLTKEELPEAGVLSPLGEGTFVACQEAYLNISDRDAVRRAQALELKLNSLGMLPTRRALSRGDWGLGKE